MTKTSIAADRQNFHRRQVQCPDVLICELDPDPPIILAKHLAIFDGVILSELRKRGWPDTSKTAVPPKGAKGSTLAAKIAKRNTLSAQDIEQLAARINWLQNNAFRWKVRNGYADYFASKKKAGPSLAGIRDAISPEVASSEEQASPRNVPEPLKNDDSTGLQPRIDTRIKPAPAQVDQGMHSGFYTRESEQNLSADSSDTKQPSGTILITEDDPRYLNPPHHIPDSPQHPESEDNTNRGSSDGRPQNITPELPDRPKTYGAGFPILKAKDFLMANAKQSPLETQLKLGKELIEDPQQLAAALAHSEQARVDLLNAFGKLGLKTDV